jgi:hypothetical protein
MKGVARTKAGLALFKCGAGSLFLQNTTGARKT